MIEEVVPRWLWRTMAWFSLVALLVSAWIYDDVNRWIGLVGAAAIGAMLWRDSQL